MGSILKVKDKYGNEINIPVLQGPKGDPSPPPEIVASIEDMTEVKKQYVLLETGNIFAFVKGVMKDMTDTVTTIDGHRLSSSGAITTDSSYVLTDYIDTQGYPGTYKIRLSGADFIPDEQKGSVRVGCYIEKNESACVNLKAIYKSVISEIGLKTVDVEDDSVVLTIAQDMLPLKTGENREYRYLRFAGFKTVGSSPKVSVEYKAASEEGEWVDTGIRYAPTLTEENKQEIAMMVFEMIDNQLSEIVGNGEILL